MDPLTDPRSLATEELKLLIQQLISREQEVSDTGQALRAQIDTLRGELVDRLRNEGTDVIFGPDTLGPGTSGVREPITPRPHQGADGIALPEPRDTDVEPGR
ncbi:MAG: hypothetical protein WAU75_04155 [Solirubrobacteraceae bacterium]